VKIDDLPEYFTTHKVIVRKIISNTISLLPRQTAHPGKIFLPRAARHITL
jgi:hypothetical protein